MPSQIEHRPDENRYLYLVDGDVVGLTDYGVVGDSIHLTHTEITPSLRGNGLGDDMVRLILDEIRDATSHRVVPDCPFVADWLRRHPEYRELESRQA